jgi:hypothetical protein
MKFEQYITLRILNSGVRGFFYVKSGRSRMRCCFGVKHRGQDFVVNMNSLTGLQSRRFALGHDRGNPLPDVTHDVVQHVAVFWIR